MGYFGQTIFFKKKTENFIYFHYEYKSKSRKENPSKFGLRHMDFK